jgi:hypothetical protein
MTPVPVGCNMFVVKIAVLIVVVWGTEPVKSTTSSAALAIDPPNTPAPAASAKAHAALRTFLLIIASTFEGDAGLRAVRKNNESSRSHSLRELHRPGSGFVIGDASWMALSHPQR